MTNNHVNSVGEKSPTPGGTAPTPPNGGSAPTPPPGEHSPQPPDSTTQSPASGGRGGRGGVGGQPPRGSAPPWALLDSYWGSDPRAQLVRHQQESYNEFINTNFKKTIDMFNPMTIHSSNDYDVATKSYRFEIEMNIINPVVNIPTIHENNGVRNTMFPHDARIRNFTYSSATTVDISLKYKIRGDDGEQTVVENTLESINIGKIPIMVGSAACVLTTMPNAPQIKRECDMDPGGYFIVNGSEKTVIAQERTVENKAVCFDVSRGNTKQQHIVDVKSVPHGKCISPRQFSVTMSKANNGFGFPMFVQLSRIRNPIPLFILFRAYGIVSDRRICEYILLHLADDEISSALLASLKSSIVDANEILTQSDAVEYISKHAMYTPKKRVYTEAGTQSEEDLTAEREGRLRFTQNILNAEVLPHCEDETQRLYYIGYMTKKLLLVHHKLLPYDDRDSYLNKRLDTTGVLLNNLLRNYYNKLTKDMQKQIVFEIDNGSWKSTDSYKNIVNTTNIYKIIKTSTIENGLKRALSTGDFGTRNGNDKVGVAQVLNRLNYMAMVAHLRRVNTPIDKSGKLIAPRKLSPSSWGFTCPAETPEGATVGIVKNLSSMAVVTTQSNNRVARDKILRITDPLSPENLPADLALKYKVFCNGTWISCTDNAKTTYDTLRRWKQAGTLSIYTSVVIDPKSREIRINNDGGRIVRPLLIVDPTTQTTELSVILGTGGTGGTTARLPTQLPADYKYCWDDFITGAKFGRTAVEYIDVEEQNTHMVAMRPSDLMTADRTASINVSKYSLCEIHPSTIFGALASCIPFPDHNQSPRNTYQCAMGKQAMGIYAKNHHDRMDKTAYVLNYPSRPLVDTRLSVAMGLPRMPASSQLMVAIMTYTGYNQEDSLLLNQGSIDRGMFQATILTTERDEDSNTHGEEEIRCKPDKSRTQGIKFGNYDKVREEGVVPENTKLERGDVIMAKVSTIKENRNDHTKTIKYRDESVVFRAGDNTYVDRVVAGRNGDGYRFVKMKMRDTRRPKIGDKFSSRHGQKGTVGNILPEEDMPYCADGTRPDLILNPHAIPSRMTIAQLKETILGKVLLEIGMFGDGTAFGDLTVDDIRKKLTMVGKESMGNELLYNGQTGEQLEANIFYGVTNYQRLKHMAADKQQSRAQGPMVNLTRQPNSGKSAQGGGGLKIGEMEKDALIAHGITKFTKDRLHDCSDAFDIHVCGVCGMIPHFNASHRINVCTMCDNRSNFKPVSMPYSFKLMSQELISMNVTPRIILE